MSTRGLENPRIATRGLSQPLGATPSPCPLPRNCLPSISAPRAAGGSWASSTADAFSSKWSIAFPTEPVRTLDSLHWDVLRLYGEMLTTLRKCAAEHGGVEAIGVDTWGVDFALLGRGNTLLGNPRHYRDPHTETILDAAFARVPRLEIFRQTGIQFMRFNTLFQLLALQRDRSPLLDVAETLLFIPDLFHFFFTGIKVNELTNASTSQMVDPSSRSWAYDLVKSFDLPANILGTLVPPGQVLGPLRPTVAAETGLAPVPVIAPGTHDTASAVAAVPAEGRLVGVHQLGHLVADGRRAAGPARERKGPSLQLHQRDWRKWHDPFV